MIKAKKPATRIAWFVLIALIITAMSIVGAVSAIASPGLASEHINTSGSSTSSPGDLDSSFGNGGIALTDTSSVYDEAYALVIQPDGKLVAGGHANQEAGRPLALHRYTSDGLLDSSFGVGGIVTATVQDIATGNALALQQDGKLVQAGASYSGAPSDQFTLARYNSNGSLDTGFGSGGKVITTVGVSSAAHAVVVQEDEKIVAAGSSLNGANGDIALVRYNSNGSLDASFGAGGRVITPIGDSDDWANALAIQSNEKLVVAGVTQSGIADKDFALVRYNSDGSLDSTFGTGGIVKTALGSRDDVANALIIRPNGKIVAGGYGDDINTPHFAIVQYNSDGSLDTSFGNGGKVVTSINSVWGDKILALGLQPDGRLVAAGYVTENSFDRIALVRYNEDGTVDNTFGADGKVVTTIAQSGYARANALVVQNDGKVVAAGYSNNGYGAWSDFVLARYLAPNEFSVSLPVIMRSYTGGW